MSDRDDKTAHVDLDADEARRRDRGRDPGHFEGRQVPPTSEPTDAPSPAPQSDAELDRQRKEAERVAGGTPQHTEYDRDGANQAASAPRDKREGEYKQETPDPFGQGSYPERAAPGGSVEQARDPQGPENLPHQHKPVTPADPRTAVTAERDAANRQTANQAKPIPPDESRRPAPTPPKRT